MARLRSELLPLAIPVALCLAAWAVILTRPAARAHHHPAARPRASLEHHTQRPPSPALDAPHESPSEQPSSAAPTPPTSAASPPAAPTRDTVVSGEVILDGISVSGLWFGDDDWRAENYRWERWYYYARREWDEWRRLRRERMARRVRSFMSPGDAAAIDDVETSSPICAVFTSACRIGARRAAPATSARLDTPATLRHEGRTWTLSNGALEAAIDPSALCAIRVARHTDDGRDALPPLTVDTPHDAPCEVTETLPPDTDVAHGGVAVAITWSGDGWSQRAVLSLADDATSPELSVTRSERIGTTLATTLTNLTAHALTWTLDGRDLSLPAARTARLGG